MKKKLKDLKNDITKTCVLQIFCGRKFKLWYFNHGKKQNSYAIYQRRNAFFSRFAKTRLYVNIAQDCEQFKTIKDFTRLNQAILKSNKKVSYSY